jgi:hypothetical protein
VAVLPAAPLHGQAEEYEQMPQGPLVASAGVAKPASLDDILRAWEQAAAQRGRLDCNFTRFRYDPTFEVETRGEGSLAVDRLGRGAYRIGPATIPAGAVVNKRNRAGVPYALKAETSDRWHWTGTNVIRMNETERTFEETKRRAKVQNGEFQPDSPELPKDASPPKAPEPINRPAAPPQPDAEPKFRVTLPEFFAGIVLGFAIVHALSNFEPADVVIERFRLARTFLLGTPARELRERFDVTILKQTDAEIWLKFRPRRQEDVASLQHITLILDVASYLPRAIKETDPTGTESVYVFKDVSVTDARDNATIILLPGREPLDRPNLAGYARAGR